MRGSKEVLWAVVITAALVTAGMILNCGDDYNGDAAVDCQAVCEKLEECEQFPLGEEVAEFFEDVEETCEESCELMLEDEEYKILDEEILECIVDTDCWDIKASCFCQEACKNLIDCEFFWGEWNTTAGCVYWCENEYYLDFIECILRYSPDCDDINYECE